MRDGLITHAQLYRFNQYVALHLTRADGRDHAISQTLYLESDMAELLAGLLKDMADDIGTTRFGDSEVGEWAVEVVCDEARLRKVSL